MFALLRWLTKSHAQWEIISADIAGTDKRRHDLPFVDDDENDDGNNTPEFAHRRVTLIAGSTNVRARSAPQSGGGSIIKIIHRETTSPGRPGCRRRHCCCLVHKSVCASPAAPSGRSARGVCVCLCRISSVAVVSRRQQDTHARSGAGRPDDVCESVEFAQPGRAFQSSVAHGRMVICM